MQLTYETKNGIEYTIDVELTHFQDNSYYINGYLIQDLDYNIKVIQKPANIKEKEIIRYCKKHYLNELIEDFEEQKFLFNNL